MDDAALNLRENFLHRSFADVLRTRGFMSVEDLTEAQRRATEYNLPLERYVVQEQLVTQDKFVLAAADYFSIPPLFLPEGYQPINELLEIRPPEFWLRVKALPLTKVNGRMTVAFADPFDLPAHEEVARAIGGALWSCVVAEQQLTDILVKYKSSQDALNPALAMENIMKGQEVAIEYDAQNVGKEDVLDATLESADEAPVIRMVNSMLIEALKTKASDIHFEAMERTSRLRYRIDGELIERPAPPKALHNAVVSRIKIMSNLNIAERRVPQDGRFKVKALKREVDVRVSILPTVHGEKVVMRILDKSNLARGLSELGLDDYAYEAMSYAISQPHGIILSTGPTGSGKTTTLYSCLQDLNKSNVNIVTAEDPVEYELPGVNQVHVNVAAGLTFAGVLRSVLRQDPDIVLVGEIRDNETADIAVKAALTGHLVLSTLHTNDAVGVIPRLVDMQVPPFLIASSLILAQAQRLYRRLCPNCRKPVTLNEELLSANHVDPAFFAGATVYGPGGCSRCRNLGYKGRGAFIEVLPISPAIRDLIERGANIEVLKAAAIKEGMITLKEIGMRKVRDGITSLEAAFEVTGGE